MKLNRILLIDHKEKRRTLLKGEIERTIEDSLHVTDMEYLISKEEKINQMLNFKRRREIFRSKLEDHDNIMIIFFHLNQDGSYDFVKFITEEKKIPLVAYTGDWPKEVKENLYYIFPYALFDNKISSMNIESFFTGWEKDKFSKDTVKNHWDKLKNE